MSYGYGYGCGCGCGQKCAKPTCQMPKKEKCCEIKVCCKQETCCENQQYPCGFSNYGEY